MPIIMIMKYKNLPIIMIKGRILTSVSLVYRWMARAADTAARTVTTSPRLTL